MKKIPTLFDRDWAGDRSRVLPGPPRVDIAPRFTPDGRRIRLTGAIATRKFDGTCCLVRDGALYKRREVKRGKPLTPGFEVVEIDETTGNTVGWVPVGDGPEDKYHREAFAKCPACAHWADGTYELIGPNVQGNPEGEAENVLVRHGSVVLEGVPSDFAGIRDYLAEHAIEGIVWWNGQPVAKIKRRDFGLPWPVKASPDLPR